MKIGFHRRRLQVALYVLCCVTFCGVWALFHGIPGIRVVMGIRQEVMQTRFAMECLARETGGIAAEKAALVSAEEGLSSVLDGLPSEEDIPDVAREFARRARNRGLRVVDADFELATVFGPGDVASGRVSRVPFRLVVSGRYEEIGRFLEELVDGAAPIEWESVALDRSAGTEGAVEAAISLNLYALAQRVGETAGEAPGGAPVKR